MSDISNWLISNGFTSEMLVLLLFLPLLATLINIGRYILGFKMLGLYPPLTLAYALYFTGLRLGIVMLIIVIISTFLSFSIFKQIRMHYISRTSLNYALITIILLIAIPIYNRYFGELLMLTYEASTILPAGIVLIAALSDFFIKKYVKNSIMTTTLALSETILIAVMGWGLLKLDIVKDFLLTYPWFVLILIPINILIGQYTGLRIKEYLRFRQIIKDE